MTAEADHLAEMGKEQLDMSNRQYSQEELRSALAGFGINDATDVSRYGSGHINDTFKVDCASGGSRRFRTDPTSALAALCGCSGGRNW